MQKFSEALANYFMRSSECKKCNSWMSRKCCIIHENFSKWSRQIFANPARARRLKLLEILRHFCSFYEPSTTAVKCSTLEFIILFIFTWCVGFKKILRLKWVTFCISWQVAIKSLRAVHLRKEWMNEVS